MYSGTLLCVYGNLLLKNFLSIDQIQQLKNFLSIDQIHLVALSAFLQLNSTVF